MFRALLDRWWWAVVLAFAAGAASLGGFLPRLDVDASTNMLLDEKDPDLAYYNASRRLWRNDDEFAIVCCRRADWFTPESLELLKAIEADLLAAPHCDRVQSIFSVPLLRSPQLPLPIPRTLDSAGVDLAKAKEELLQHTLAKGTLVSADGRDAVLLAYLAGPPELETLERERSDALQADDGARLAKVEPAYQAARDVLRSRRREFVDAVRAVAAKWSPRLDEPVALSGLPVINLNLVEHVSHDLRLFGVVSFAVFTLAFALIYRKARWTALPILSCLLPVALILGTMAALDLKLTIITANLPLLLFVVMLPYTVYFAERYLERRARNPEETQGDSSSGAARDIWMPCLFSCTTTMAGFFSLTSSGVKPVKWFGWMMTAGLGIGLACVFLFLPSASHRLRPLAAPRSGAGDARPAPGGPVRWLERLVLRAPGAVVAAAVAVLAVSAWGVTRIDVENKFIDYFWPSSEVHRGLERIDRRMGGTTPLDVVLTSKEPGFFKTQAGLDAIAAASRYFDGVPEVGSVWSVGTLLAEARKAMPQANVDLLTKFRQTEPLFRDVATADFSSTRILVRFRETAPTLHRNRILAGLREHLAGEPSLADLSPRATGVFLLYANMLNSLVESQRDTGLVVVAAIFAMLLVLFRAPLLSLLVLVPQVLPALVCLGVMGFAGIPLDLITVMVAAVAMGVGIDAAIQYTVRFRTELAATGGDRRAAVTRSHATIGRAIWIATSIMMAGFAVLALSDFVPTVTFGLFNALAMLMGQVAALTVVPALFLLTGIPRR